MLKSALGSWLLVLGMLFLKATALTVHSPSVADITAIILIHPCKSAAWLLLSHTHLPFRWQMRKGICGLQRLCSKAEDSLTSPGSPLLPLKQTGTFSLEVALQIRCFFGNFVLEELSTATS